MKPVEEIRRTNLNLLIEEFGGLTSFCNRIERSDSQVSQWATGAINSGTGKKRNISPSSCRYIEEKTNKPKNWMDYAHEEDHKSNIEDGPSLRGTVPLISWVQAGHWQEAMDLLMPGEGERIETTYKVKKHTYALRVKGDSMEPKFPNGCLIIVEPEEHPEPGKFVIIRQNGDEATFKQLIQDGSTLFLRPLNDRYPFMVLKKDAVFCGVIKKMEMDI